MIKVVLLALAFYLGWMSFYVIYFDDWRLPECILYGMSSVFVLCLASYFKWPTHPLWKAKTLPVQKWLQKVGYEICLRLNIAAEWIIDQVK